MRSLREAPAGMAGGTLREALGGAFNTKSTGGSACRTERHRLARIRRLRVSPTEAARLERSWDAFVAAHDGSVTAALGALVERLTA